MIGGSRVACLGLGLAFASPALAEPPSHQDELYTFSTVLATGSVVPDHCPDITVVTSGLSQLAVTLHITQADEMAVQLQSRIFTKFFSDQADKADAKTWCDDVYKTFGPDGVTVRGYLRR